MCTDLWRLLSQVPLFAGLFWATRSRQVDPALLSRAEAIIGDRYANELRRRRATDRARAYR